MYLNSGPEAVVVHIGATTKDFVRLDDTITYTGGSEFRVKKYD